MIKLGSASKTVWFTDPPKPILGIPEGTRARLRIRPDTFPTLFIKTAAGITRHYLEDHGAHWSPSARPFEENRTVAEPIGTCIRKHDCAEPGSGPCNGYPRPSAIQS